MRSIYVLILLTIALTSCSTPVLIEGEGIYLEEEEFIEVTVQVDPSIEEKELFELVNAHRESIGLAALEFGGHAYKLAQDHNETMIAKGSLSHDRFDQRAMALARKTRAVLVGENVAKDYTEVERALEGWLLSPSHRKTLEGDFTHAGLSISYDTDGNPYYTQIFYKKE